MSSTFGEFLSEKRKALKLTQKDIAKELFVTESAVSKWEKNVSIPNITLIPKLCKILNVTEHELITASDDTVQRQKNLDAKKWSTLSLTTKITIFFFVLRCASDLFYS